MSLKSFLSALVLNFVFTPLLYAAPAETLSQGAPDNPTAIQATNAESQSLATDKVNINTASTKELKGISGVTANKARAIVKYRKQHGPFKSVDELKLVNGFKRLSDEKLKAMQEHMTAG